MRWVKLSEKGKRVVSETRRISVCIITVCVLSLALLAQTGGAIDAGYAGRLLSEAVVLSIISMGAVFIFSAGAFGISLGASTLMGAAVGGAVYAESGSIIAAFFACICVPVAGCVASSLLSGLFKLPKYVTAAVMLAIFVSVARAVFEWQGGVIQTGLGGGRYADSLYVRMLCFSLYLLLCVAVFYILPIGRRQRLLGQDGERARLSGISRISVSAMGATVAGIGVGLGAFLILCSYPSIDRSVTGDLGFNIIFAVLLGGVSLSGGDGSRLYSAIFGGVSAILISEILSNMLGTYAGNMGISQVIRAIMLLILFVTVNPCHVGGQNG